MKKNSFAFSESFNGTVKEFKYSEAVELFNKNPYNRETNWRHVAKIKKSIADRSYFKNEDPIKVNLVTRNIIDGHHRMEAFVQAYDEGDIGGNTLIKVYFLKINKKEEYKYILDCNNNRLSWKTKDFLNLADKLGDESVRKLKEVMKGRELFVNSGVLRLNRAVLFATGKTFTRKELENLNFNITDENCQTATEMHDEVIKILDAFELGHSGHYVDALARSWYAFRKTEHANLDELSTLMTKRDYRKHAKMLKNFGHSSKADWDFVFEQSVNKIEELKSKSEWKR